MGSSEWRIQNCYSLASSSGLSVRLMKFYRKCFFGLAEMILKKLFIVLRLKALG